MLNRVKNNFGRFGLFYVLLAFSIGSSLDSVAAEKNKKAKLDTESKTFKNWSYSCEKNDADPKKKFCYISQVLSVESVEAKTKKKLTNRIADYKIGYFSSDKGGSVLKMVQTLPLGCLIQSGTAIIKDKSQIIAKGSYSVCYKEGCVAISEINEDIIQKIISSKESVVAFGSNENKQVNLQLSQEGLGEAFAYLKANK
jgi:invasion protein IalB